MLIPILLHAASLVAGISPKPISYTIHVDTTALNGIRVEMQIDGAREPMTLAAQAHPEYDDKYWRYISELSATGADGRSIPIRRVDSVRWSLAAASGPIVVRYRVAFPDEGSPRSSWRPFVATTGGLLGGPHSFLYVIGSEASPATVTLDIPASWKVATGLHGASTDRQFSSPDMYTLFESPFLVGKLREWKFNAAGVPHRIFYWPSPDAAPFDTVSFVRGITQLTSQAIALFGGAPYREFTFQFQDGAYSGGLEHLNSVTLGASSVALAKDPHAFIEETAHEFIHTWNLMAIRPREYRGVDFHVQPPVSELWFSEGLTMFYADALLRRAGLPLDDSTRLSHLRTLMQYYLDEPGNSRFSAESVSRVEYNAGPGALGDYTASTHLQGELIGTMLDLLIRDATNGARSMDDVMRRMFAEFRGRAFNSGDVQRTANAVCRCDTRPVFAQYVFGANPIDFNAYLQRIGLRADVSIAEGRDPDGKPTRDLRIWGTQEGSAPLRLVISNPESVWGRAGLHSGDELVAINGVRTSTWPELRSRLVAMQIGDTARVAVRRTGGEFATTVTMRARERHTVTLKPIAASARTAQLREAWLAGR